jgi:hypothetical protein
MTFLNIYKKNIFNDHRVNSTYILKNVQINIVKRTMFSLGSKIITKLATPIRHDVKLIGKQNPTFSNRNACNRVVKTNAQNSTPEQVERNPILQTKNGKPYQHYSAVRDFCENNACESKLCVDACGNIIQSQHDGHFSHGNLGEDFIFVSYTDLNENPFAQQNIKHYSQPCDNPDIEGKNTDIEKTKALKKNKEMLETIHRERPPRLTKSTNSTNNTANNYDENIN